MGILKKTGLYDGAGSEWDESKHPRDELGRFTKVKFGEWDGKRYKQSGAISGALNSEEEPDRARTEKHAEITYERIRRVDSDVKKIAQATRFSEEEVRRIKNHMFFNEYDLRDGRHRFDPDFDQAQSWDRLQSGKALPHDLIMLEHEAEESKWMAEGMGYDEAHEIANKEANYKKALEEYKSVIFKKERD